MYNNIQRPIFMPPPVNMIPYPIQSPVNMIPYPIQPHLFIQPSSPISLRPRIMIPMDRYLRRINMPQNINSKETLETIYNVLLNTINYIGIIFINSDGILFIKNTINDVWNIPFDRKGINETDNDTLSRIFKDKIETELIQSEIISNNKYIRMHRNGKKSKIFVIRSKQEIPLSLSKDFIFIPLENLKDLINNDTPYKQVNKIIDFNKSLFKHLINKI